MAYCIGDNRKVIVKKQDGELVVIIEEVDSEKKRIVFTGPRWTRFLLMINKIDQQVDLMLNNQYVFYNEHIGGKWHASVTTGFMCVDLRQFYFHPIGCPKPTKTGIALRLTEWGKLKMVISELMKMYPALALFQPCNFQHHNQEAEWSCAECSPFYEAELSFLQTTIPSIF
jgi:hypothetical protein